MATNTAQFIATQSKINEQFLENLTNLNHKVNGNSKEGLCQTVPRLSYQLETVSLKLSEHVAETAKKEERDAALREEREREQRNFQRNLFVMFLSIILGQIITAIFR